MNNCLIEYFGLEDDEIKINKPYSELTEEEIENICRYFDLRRDCESCPLDKTRYCYQRYEPEENDVCKCEIEKRCK